MGWHDVVCYGMRWYGVARHGMMCNDLVLHSMKWSGMRWHCIAWHGMAWHDMHYLPFFQFHTIRVAQCPQFGNRFIHLITTQLQYITAKSCMGLSISWSLLLSAFGHTLVIKRSQAGSALPASILAKAETKSWSPLALCSPEGHRRGLRGTVKPSQNLWKVWHFCLWHLQGMFSLFIDCLFMLQ